MPKSFQEKKREIKYSLNRRSRLRKAYFKLTGSERPAETIESKVEAKDLDLENPDSEDEQTEQNQEQQKLTKKQIASRKRQEKYREMKLAEERRKTSEINRKIKAKRATARTKKGQPKLGAQVGLLLDKIRESS